MSSRDSRRKMKNEKNGNTRLSYWLRCLQEKNSYSISLTVLQVLIMSTIDWYERMNNMLDNCCSMPFFSHASSSSTRDIHHPQCILWIVVSTNDRANFHPPIVERPKTNMRTSKRTTEYGYIDYFTFKLKKTRRQASLKTSSFSMISLVFFRFVSSISLSCPNKKRKANLPSWQTITQPMILLWKHPERIFEYLENGVVQKYKFRICPWK